MPLRLAHTKCGCRLRLRPKLSPLALLISSTLASGGSRGSSEGLLEPLSPQFLNILWGILEEIKSVKRTPHTFVCMKPEILDPPLLASIEGICSYAIITEILCTGPDFLWVFCYIYIEKPYLAI